MHAPSQNVDEPAALAARLLALWERTGDPALERIAQGRAPRDGSPITVEQERTDWVSTCLMENYRNTGDASVFALLYEINRPLFAIAIQGQLRRAFHHVDSNDVLQEVFLNIYRYPHRFVADRADAFRNWGHRIVRNTLLKFLRGESRQARILSMEDEVQFADARAHSPERVAVDGESAAIVNQAYLLYLSLYLLHFQRLSDKERYALTRVEVDGISYRDAASELGIRLENLKMVIFRGRRKIFRGMARSLEELHAGGNSRPRRTAGRSTARDPIASNPPSGAQPTER